MLAAQSGFVMTLRQSGLPIRRPPATGLLGHYPDRTLTGKPINLAGHTFTIGLYPWSLPDEGQADGSLLFRTRLCVRAVSHTPERPDELTPDQGSPDMAFAVT